MPDTGPTPDANAPQINLAQQVLVIPITTPKTGTVRVGIAFKHIQLWAAQITLAQMQAEEAAAAPPQLVLPVGIMPRFPRPP